MTGTSMRGKMSIGVRDRHHSDAEDQHRHDDEGQRPREGDLDGTDHAQALLDKCDTGHRLKSPGRAQKTASLRAAYRSHPRFGPRAHGPSQAARHGSRRAKVTISLARDTVAMETGR